MGGCRGGELPAPIVSMPRNPEDWRKWNRSEKGKAAATRWNRSEKGRAASRRYRATPEGKMMYTLNNQKPARLLANRLREAERRKAQHGY
jgi:hypothetical protein